MEKLKQTIQKVFDASGLSYSVDVDEEGKRVNIFIHDESIKRDFPKLVFEVEHLVQVMAKNLGIDRVNVDLNNYKKERENLIVELAKASARKVVLEKKEISLPAMNAYERRIVHVELATRPDIKTESIGEGQERHIIVKPI